MPMDIKELQSKSHAELGRLAQELRHQQQKMRFQVASRQAGNTSQMKKLKQDLACVEMLLSRPAETN